MSITFEHIGTDDIAFWCSLAFNSKIYFGGYGHPKGYNYPPWTLIKSFAAGESLTRFGVFDSKLYCITENLGKIYRMDTEDPTSWVVVHDDGYKWGLGMDILGSYIYGCFNTTGEVDNKIIYSSTGSLGDWDLAENWNGGSICVLVAYDGNIYAIGRKGTFGTGIHWARRGSETTWAKVSKLCSSEVEGKEVVGDWRAGVVFNGKLFLGMGDRDDGKSKIYSFDGTDLSGELFSKTVFKPHYACVCNGKMYWLFGPHMNQPNANPVNYYLYQTPTGDVDSWEHVKTFSAIPASSHGKYRTKGCVGCLDNKLYVAVQNKVYEKEDEEPPRQPQVIFI